MNQNHVLTQALKSLLFWLLNLAAETATHKDYDNFFWRYPTLCRRVHAGSLFPARQVMGLSQP